jgi:type II secretory ATPase GspE/PulE/Tfp pilus assembly ATPase PilB-like protein
MSRAEREEQAADTLVISKPDTPLDEVTAHEFGIHFVGPLGSGKTVAMNKLLQTLADEGYEVHYANIASRDGFEHKLRVRWSK